MCYLQISPNIGFYLQDAYVKAWIENTMLFLERDELESYREHCLEVLQLPEFRHCRITEIRTEDWGREFFLHDPAGNLWHVGEFTVPV